MPRLKASLLSCTSKLITPQSNTGAELCTEKPWTSDSSTHKSRIRHSVSSIYNKSCSSYIMLKDFPKLQERGHCEGLHSK